MDVRLTKGEAGNRNIADISVGLEALVLLAHTRTQHTAIAVVPFVHSAGSTQGLVSET